MAECIISGRQGPKGDTGIQGPQGATGPQGPTGPAGNAGTKATYYSSKPSIRLASNQFAIGYGNSMMFIGSNANLGEYFINSAIVFTN